MTTEEDFQHVTIRSSEGRADRHLGSTTSKGYAPNVPDYFKRENPTNNYRANGHSIDSLDIDRSAVMTYPIARKIEARLKDLSVMVKAYFPQSTRKALVDRTDFLDLGQKIDSLLERSKMEPKINEFYRTRYNELIAEAYEKCKGTTGFSKQNSNNVSSKPKRGRPRKTGIMLEPQEAILISENVTG